MNNFADPFDLQNLLTTKNFLTCGMPILTTPPTTHHTTAIMATVAMTTTKSTTIMTAAITPPLAPVERSENNHWISLLKKSAYKYIHTNVLCMKTEFRAEIEC